MHPHFSPNFTPIPLGNKQKWLIKKLYKQTPRAIHKVFHILYILSISPKLVNFKMTNYLPRRSPNSPPSKHEWAPFKQKSIRLSERVHRPPHAAVKSSPSNPAIAQSDWTTGRNSNIDRVRVECLSNCDSCMTHRTVGQLHGLPKDHRNRRLPNCPGTSEVGLEMYAMYTALFANVSAQIYSIKQVFETDNG